MTAGVLLNQPGCRMGTSRVGITHRFLSNWCRFFTGVFIMEQSEAVLVGFSSLKFFYERTLVAVLLLMCPWLPCQGTK
jgi:hypothetical protein